MNREELIAHFDHLTDDEFRAGLAAARDRIEARREGRRARAANAANRLRETDGRPGGDH